MLSINYIANWNQLHYEIDINELIDFLYNNLDKFRDSKSAIRKAIDYALSEENGKGGFIVTAREDSELMGILVMNQTGMSEYIPEYILVYIAVKDNQRGKGIGTQMIKSVLEKIKHPVALHVEYDNPAKNLYEKLGFTTKYAEMRYIPQEAACDKS